MTDGKKGKPVEAAEQSVDSKMAAELQHETSDPLAGLGKGQLDRWFDTQLMQMYAEVVNEPLPKTFLELLDKIRERKPHQ